MYFSERFMAQEPALTAASSGRPPDRPGTLRQPLRLRVLGGRQRVDPGARAAGGHGPASARAPVWDRRRTARERETVQTTFVAKECAGPFVVQNSATAIQ